MLTQVRVRVRGWQDDAVAAPRTHHLQVAPSRWANESAPGGGTRLFLPSTHQRAKHVLAPSSLRSSALHPRPDVVLRLLERPQASQTPFSQSFLALSLRLYAVPSAQKINAGFLMVPPPFLGMLPVFEGAAGFQQYW